MAELTTRLCGLTLPHPFVLASGPLSYGAEGIRAAFAAGAAAVVTKTIGLQAAVNPTPHIWMGARSSLLNTEKWSDLPPEQWLERELPALRERDGVLICSVGNAPADVAALAGPLAAAGADLLEVVSYSAVDTAPMVELAVKRGGVPVLAKVSANWPDMLEVVAGCVAAGAAGITAIDSIGPVLQIDLETGRPIVAGGQGHAWLSGAAIKPLAVRAVADIRLRHDIPVVATGGVMNARDAAEMLMVGATAVAAHTSPLLQGLTWFRRAQADLNRYLDERGYDSLAEIRGRSLPFLGGDEPTGRLHFGFGVEMCNECRLCVRLCPYAARELSERHMRLDTARCRSCGLCVSVCASGALTMMGREE